MKQIKLLMLIACFGFFGAVNAQTTIGEVTTYRWTGLGANSNWNNPLNWTIESTSLVLPDEPAAYPNLTPEIIPGEIVNGEQEPDLILTQVHNVIIPAVSNNNYPTLTTAAPNLPTITINDLVLETGATLSLVGKTLVISGTLSGPGLLIGSTTSDLAFDGVNKMNIKRTQTEVDAFFPPSPAAVYSTNNFELLSGFFQLGYTDTKLGYTFTAQAPDLSILFIPTPSGKQMSTNVETDEITIEFEGSLPVYTFSADFSITDLNGTPTTIGLAMPFAGAAAPVPPNDIVEFNQFQILVNLADESTFTYLGDAEGELVGFTTQQPIKSIVVSTAVKLIGDRPVGFVTIDNVKFGGRIGVGTLNMATGPKPAPLTGNYTNGDKTLGSLSVNVAPVVAAVDVTNNIAAVVDGITLSNELRVVEFVHPASGIINSSPAQGVSNLTLLSNFSGTASVLEHLTTDGTISGTVNVQRYIGDGFDGFDDATRKTRKKQWRFLGFPYRDALTVGNISGIRVSFATPTLMDFNEAQANDALGNTDTRRNNGYLDFTSAAQQLPVLSGLAAWIHDIVTDPSTGFLDQPQTLATSGRLWEDGNDVVKSLTSTRNLPLAQKGWNLISNPFASTINWDNNAISKIGIEGAIYRWDPQSELWTSYNNGTSLPSNSADGFIESGSSFFVKSNATVSSLTFSQAAKVFNQTSVLNQFKKNGAKLGIVQQAVGSTASKIKSAGIRINASGPGNPIPSQAYLNLSQVEATEGFDAKFDAHNMGRSSGAHVAIKGADKLEFGMQYDRPIAEAGKEKRYYPLKVSVPSSGKTKIELELEGNWNSLNTVYLIDKKEGKATPLSGNKLSYEFNMVNTVENDRFMLAINHVNVAEKSGITATDVRVMNNPVRADVIDAIIAHPTAKARSYSVVNASGATVNKGSIEDNNSVQHRLGFGKSSTNGVMYLRVDFENGDSKTVKFIKL